MLELKKEDLGKLADSTKFFKWVEEEYLLQVDGRWVARDRGMAASEIGIAKDYAELYKFFHKDTVFNAELHKVL